MARNERGFTLIEIMITLVILVIVLAAASGLFVTVLGQYKQQSKIAETGMERLVGLEILRRDVEHAGYGLPWTFQSGVAYSEAASGDLNDAPSGIPRAILSDNTGLFTNSDRLVVKSVFVGRNPISQRWMLLPSSGVPRPWTPDPPSSELGTNLRNGDRVIVMQVGVTDDSRRSLVVDGGYYYTDFALVSNFKPMNPSETRVIYGIDNVPLGMPFNRAEYFISNVGVPERCAPGTGVLVKSIVRHDSGALDTPLPLLDCVASFRVQYQRDVNNNGAITTSDDISTLTAQQIRDQLKEVRISILAHEGQRDPNYSHPTNPGDTITFIGQLVPVDRQFRWRTYTLSVVPISLKD